MGEILWSDLFRMTELPHICTRQGVLNAFVMILFCETMAILGDLILLPYDALCVSMSMQKDTYLG